MLHSSTKCIYLLMYLNLTTLFIKLNCQNNQKTTFLVQKDHQLYRKLQSNSELYTYFNIVYEYQYLQLCKKNSILILNNENASGITLDMGTQRFLYYGCKLFTTHKSHRNPNFSSHFGETEQIVVCLIGGNSGLGLCTYNPQSCYATGKGCANNLM